VTRAWWRDEDPLWVRLGVGGLATWALDAFVLAGVPGHCGGSLEDFESQVLRSHGPGTIDGARRELRRAAAELLRAKRERPSVGDPRWEREEVAKRVDALVARVGARPFDWALPAPSFLCVYRTRDDDEWRRLGGELARPGQHDRSFVADLRVTDWETGRADVIIDAWRLGGIRSSEPAIAALPVVRIEGVEYDPARWPTPVGERAAGRWST
jgi:hypothetical protein